MIISHKHKFIFIKNMKVAGTSIETFLSQHCGPGDIVTPVHPEVEGHVPRNHEGHCTHDGAETIKKHLGEVRWRDYFKFCVERNPWDKTISYYHMTKHDNATDWGKRLPTFDEFIEAGDFPVDYHRYTDSAGAIMVDRVLRYEDLGRGLAEVFAMIGIPFSGDLGVKAKSEFRDDHRPYQEVYSKEQATAVSKAFSREIERFGYSFSYPSYSI